MDGDQCFLKHVVAELIVDQLLDNKVYSCFQIRLGSREAELVDDLEVVLWEGALKDLFNVCFLSNIQV